MRMSADVLLMQVKKADAALTNEQITRKRVDYIEGILGRSILGRLKWLLLGK